MDKIDFSKTPVEPTIDIIDNHGNVVVTTNSDIVFLYARVQIKHLHLDGWKVRCHSNGLIVEIDSFGRIKSCENGSFPGDEAEKLMAELL